MDLLVTYDVDTTTSEGAKRLRKVARTCEAFGHRVQKSVFEVVCSESQKLRLVAQLVEIIEPAQDSIRLYQLPHRALDEVEHLGRPRAQDPRGPFIV